MRLRLSQTALFAAITAINLLVPRADAAEENPNADVRQSDQEGIAFFEKRIRPVLVEHCFECHSSGLKKSKGGLRLDSKREALAGGDSGTVIVPGKPDESLLIDAVAF